MVTFYAPSSEIKRYILNIFGLILLDYRTFVLKAVDFTYVSVVNYRSCNLVFLPTIQKTSVQRNRSSDLISS